ncbi:photosystem reaction center subunit H [Streptomyces fumigatiscleroticus]|nr:photosystem reaction center subunit H [Streptomyces fumigatiscleroticus]
MHEPMTVRSLTTRPVVTLGGDAVAQVKDTVLDAGAGHVTGFTLSGRGLLSGALKRALPWPAVHSLGHDAVMIRDLRDLTPAAVVMAGGEALRSRVLGARVVTDAGTEVGTVLDVVVEGGTGGRVVGFRIAARKAFVPGSRHRRRRVYVPRGETLDVCGRTLVIPAETARRAAEDLRDLAARLGVSHAARKGPLP